MVSRPAKGYHRCTHSVWNINHRETWTPWETLAHPQLRQLLTFARSPIWPRNRARKLGGQKNPGNFYEKPGETGFDRVPPDKNRARIKALGRGRGGGKVGRVFTVNIQLNYARVYQILGGSLALWKSCKINKESDNLSSPLLFPPLSYHNLASFYITFVPYLCIYFNLLDKMAYVLLKIIVLFLN